MIQRWAEARILKSLAFIDVTLVAGPRQAGKTTLCRSIAQRRGMPFLSMDHPKHLAHISTDPIDFFESYPRAFIDEIQRAPELILPLKYVVDLKRSRGRYLISGSVDLWGSGITPDSLAGRMQLVELLPFARGEMLGLAPSTLITEAFQGEISCPSAQHSFDLRDLALLITQGGYPEVVLSYHSAEEKRRWLQTHVQFVAQHDLPHIEDVRKKDKFIPFLTYLSCHCAQLMNLSTCAASLQLTSQTIQRWLVLLEHMFLIKRLPAWHKNTKKKLAKAPKYHFLDTGLSAALQGYDAERLVQDPVLLGGLLENYVFTEISKIISDLDDEIYLYHYRDHNKNEVDFVLERRKKVVGIEIKAARTVLPRDFAGLRVLKEMCGEDFVCGMILYRGDQVEKTQGNLFAVPLGKLLNNEFLMGK